MKRKEEREFRTLINGVLRKCNVKGKVLTKHVDYPMLTKQDKCRVVKVNMTWLLKVGSGTLD